MFAIMCQKSTLDNTDPMECCSCSSPLQEPYIHCIDCDPSRVNICLPCFSKGLEFGAHGSHHRYEVVKNDFPLFEPTWTAAEEVQLLDAIAECGIGNWEAVAQLMMTKTKQQCHKHYHRCYIDSPKPPLPTMKEPEIMFQPNPLVFKLSEDPPRPAEGSTLQLEMAGYMAGRGDFMVEHDNYAETDLNELSMNSDDDLVERPLKLAVLDVYRDVLVERQRRRKIIRDYGLINVKKLGLYNRKYNFTLGSSTVDSLRVFKRLLSPLEWDRCVESLHLECELRQYIMKLREYRENGIMKLHSGQMYDHLKQRRQSEKSERHLLNDVLGHFQNQIFSAQQSHSRHVVLDKISKGLPIPSYATTRKNAPPLDVVGLPAYEKLTPKEKQLCSLVRLVPESYLEFRRILLAECAKHGCLKLAQARTLLKIDVNKTRKLYDFLIDEGYINREPLK